MLRATHLVPILLAGAIVAACDGATPTDAGSLEVLTEVPVARQGRQQVPFKEDYTATGTITPAASCGGGTLRVALEGAGTATHIGRYTITNSHCLDLTTGAFTGGVFVKTAANGDQLFGTYSGIGSIIVPPEPVGRFAIQGTLEFTGGTGRFAGTSGTESMQGIQVTDFSQPGFPTSITLRIEGTISSVGSGR
ncbi:hypothetical protein BH24GEM1_BH24GEM1_20590 [soil metagenome]